jgi:hypothetical protein
MFDYIQRSMKEKHDELDRIEKKKQTIQYVNPKTTRIKNLWKFRKKSKNKSR